MIAKFGMVVCSHKKIKSNSGFFKAEGCGKAKTPTLPKIREEWGTRKRKDIER
jgi:hypothetical protein